jgi:hypothetical protein
MAFTIKEQPNVFDDAFLDIIGNEFKFDHVKGLAEWIKNSADAYTRADVPDASQFIYLRFSARASSRAAAFSCIDFIGMTSDDIDKAFKRWGDRRAASRGSGKRTLGGHGNGGKFYMRQMFARSQFVTYRDGRLNVFGFNERKRYGYADGYENRKMGLEAALEFAGLGDFRIPSQVRNLWKASGPGFTVVTGEAPERLRAWKSHVSEICRKLRVHPQSRRLVRHKQVFVWVPPAPPQRLAPEEIEPRPGFEGPFTFELPATLDHAGKRIVFRNAKFPDGRLTLGTSAEPFSRAGERSALNSVDILGEVGCIGSYRLNELGYLKHAAQAEFLYGECYCPILEDPDDDCVRNDREKLVDTDKTQALLVWIRARVDEICGQIADQEQKERKRAELDESSALNDLLNKWKNRFMSRILAEVLAGAAGDGGVGPGGQSGTEPWFGDGGASGGGRRQGGEGTGGTGGGAGEGRKRAPRFPRVLLSGHDPDPLDPQNSLLNLDARHPAVYQRTEDVPEAIYWINCSRPLAQRIIEQYKVKSTRWRDYLFQRHIEIILKEALYQMAKREPELTAEKIDDLWNKVQLSAHDAAAQDLEAFLFEEAFAAAGD